ncbi:MAG: glycosyltransferase [Fibromonadaceae bacterium]|jgi:glycosyltransferase involved in cell wall biosynthesis|nr:glycosyltransferase [Fibromonadaceae bacterium]
MKKILFDFITLQDNHIGGGGLYTQKIFYEILNNKVEIHGLYDGNIPINEKVEKITKQHKVHLINIRDENICETINNMQIDTFFIGIAQIYNNFDLCSLRCKVVIVCHDVSDKSLEYSEVLQSKSLKTFTEKYLIKNKKSKIRLIIKLLLYPLVLFRRYMIQRRVAFHYENFYENFKKLIQQANVFVITDSEYSKYSIQYFLDVPKNEIKVFYPPISNENVGESIENFSKLKDKKYFLLISVDRSHKNVALFLEQWRKFCLATKHEYHCVLVGKIKVNMKNCIIIEKVSSEELANLYKNAFAFIYPSYSEGFGYPPIEAAEYATPSICSNVTSIPEICGDMPVYFSPFYPEDLFRAMIEMTRNREFYVEKTKKRFLELNQRQKADLEKLINFILGENHDKNLS